MTCFVWCFCNGLAFLVDGPSFSPGAETAERQCVVWSLENSEMWCETSAYYAQFCGLAAPSITVREG